MARQSGHRTKIIQEDVLLYEGAAKSRATLRMCLGILMVLVALGFLFLAVAPLLVKSNLPLLWVAYANENGWTKYIQNIGQSLLAKGRVELFPIWGSYLALIGCAGFAWFGAHMIRNRFEAKAMGEVFTRGYWVNFYLLKPKKSDVTVEFKDIKRKP